MCPENGARLAPRGPVLHVAAQRRHGDFRVAVTDAEVQLFAGCVAAGAGGFVAEEIVDGAAVAVDAKLGIDTVVEAERHVAADGRFVGRRSAQNRYLACSCT